ncbi:MAG: toxin-antitoxin system YwqK family antitoxin [Candidatus Cyclobacteriaceae bacterium M3_2C_046]
MNKAVVVVCITVLCTFISMHLTAQVNVKIYYDQNNKQIKENYFLKDSASGKLQGPYQSFYSNGNFKSSGQFEANQPTGLWKYYFENGKLKMKGELKNNSNHGFWQYYYENGNLSMEGHIYQGKREGEWINYFENGHIKSEGTYHNDQKEGIWNYYFEDGLLKAQGFYKQDQGMYKEFYPSGNLKMYGKHIEGLSDSTWVFLYEDGTRKALGDFNQGQRMGSWKYFYPNGNLSAEGNYQKGEKMGKWSYYHENGELSSEGAELAGKKDGYWKFYHHDGSFKGESILNNGDGEYKEFHDNSQLKVNGQIENGLNHGHWVYYYDDGVLEGEADFIKGVGEYTGYYKDGAVKMKGKIENGKSVGVWQLFETDGSLAGYYRPYYEDEKPVYKVIETLESRDHNENADYMKPEYRFRTRRNKYFTPRINEFQGIIISTNPMAMTLGSLPISVEYYLQERLGHELLYTVVRDPFFNENSQIALGNIYKRGFFVALKQKFYHPDDNLGMFYFGHEIRYTSLDHMANVIKTDTTYRTTLTMSERRFEYSIIFGDRWIKYFGERWINESNKSGITIDIYGGIGIGYRITDPQYEPVPEYEEVFKNINNKKVSIPIRFGVTIGYVF